MGESDEEAAAAVEMHVTADGVAGAGGRVAGASKAWVATNTGVGRLGGMMKWRCSSLEDETARSAHVQIELAER